MRILHFISSPAAGGAEVYVRDLSKELVRAGHEVHVGFLEGGLSEENAAFRRRFLGDLDHAGVRYFIVGGAARRLPVIGAFKVRSYVHDNRIDVYHSHLIYGASFGALVDVPRIYTHHSSLLRRRMSFSIVKRFVDQLVGISTGCAETLSSRARADVVTIFNGVDRERVSRDTNRPRVLEDPVRCLAVGRICDDKNYALMVKALSLVPPKVRERLVLDIAGDGEAAEKAALTQQLEAARLSDRVRLLGVREDVPQLLASSQLFLMSSVTEGMPVALIEAAMSGLPCIVTDVGGCREVVERCGNGIVVPDGDAEALASAIARLIGEPSLVAEYSRNALERSDVFSIEKAGAAHINLYNGLLARAAQAET